MANPWQLYDDLIDLVPPGIRVTDAVLGTRAYVDCDPGTGVALRYAGGSHLSTADRDVRGKDLRDVAMLAKSWDFDAAALGVAGLCAALNTSQRLAPYPPMETPGQTSTFIEHADRFAGRKVAVIGHFGGIERHVADSDFIVLERNPRGADFPDAACEYLLADRDDVYITGSALVNKTLPRLLELSRHARVTLVGPSCPFAPEVFTGTVAEIAGARVVDRAVLRREIVFGGSLSSAHTGFAQFSRLLKEK